jgi:hypothetical protein
MRSLLIYLLVLLIRRPSPKTATNEGVPRITYGRIKYREERRKKNGMYNGAAP